ncbi:MAG: hypothetical protein Q9219_006857 [cf. Caloplaca sp. 3 TL-2023]
MEVFVRNLHDEATEQQIKLYFKPILARLSIHIFHCQKPKNRGFAKITVGDVQLGQKFLDLHGQVKPGRDGFISVKEKLFHYGKPVNCCKSYSAPDEFVLKSLELEKTRKSLAGQRHVSKPSTASGQRTQRVFECSLVAVGLMDYSGIKLVIADHYGQHRQCSLTFGRRAALIKLKDVPVQMQIPYHSIQSLLIGRSADPFVTFSLAEAPRCFLMQSPEDVALIQLMRRLTTQPSKNTAPERQRITAIDSKHRAIIASCLCYSFRVDPGDVQRIMALKRLPGYPDIVQWHIEVVPSLSFPSQMSQLNSALSAARYKRFPFEVKFQLQRLAQNGYLPPVKVLQLMLAMKRTFIDVNDSVLAAAVRRFSNQIPYAGPGTEASDLALDTLHQLLIQNYDDVLHEEGYSKDITQQYEHIASIYKATVTPAGIYLSGPEPEVKNRVLRQYSAFSNYFLQVSFLDEDGETLRNERGVSLASIYHERYKDVLAGNITVAGRPYEFLGFSHSSLRAQTCWFMAPFTWKGELRYARAVIKDLGDFSAIRSPAKCAARIGQAFSQVFSSVNIPREAFQVLPDVEKTDTTGVRRTFSDGVGTCSKAILRRIWEAYAQSRIWKPTVCQIRYAGAKGMISLDDRLPGEALCLRPSMIKFQAASTQIEICGAGFKPLNMYLNRQLIKILEDLGVPEQAFMDLQDEAVEQLRITAENPINASSYLQRNLVGKSARLPWLIRKLYYMGLSFSDDSFLRHTHELAILVQLRELKYRSRIYVERGMTLFGWLNALEIADEAKVWLGIMDETDYLEEGQIYCSVQNEKSGEILTGRAVITRCPALHPGDVQYVEAVDVPTDSPLRSVHNCVVFSSQGDRDLPSQLSGGDLDGDLYNIIYDDCLMPTKMSEPASYPVVPPIDIGREVVRDDMTDFFVQFMENDQLGRLSTLHQTLADQKLLGVFDPDCILLAEMCSTAVDFSKTGIPVDLSKTPKSSRVRPDFQAPGPRVLIEKTIKLEEANEEEDDGEDELEDMTPVTQYYRSEKVLGKLYRAIDEHDFFAEIQRQSGTSLPAGRPSLAEKVWDYVQQKTALIQYHHHLEFARNVKDGYEDNMINTMSENSPHPTYFVSEVEVFAGALIGKHGAQTKRQREFSTSMKEKQDRDVAYTIQCILQGEEQDISKEEALERSIACLYVAIHEPRVRRRFGRLVSFTWVAAAVCLKEVEKFGGH